MTSHDGGEFLTVAQAAKLADRSKTVVRRWIIEGWISKAFGVPGRNGAWLIDKAEFESKLPSILDEMQKRRGGRGNKATDAAGNLRG